MKHLLCSTCFQEMHAGITIKVRLTSLHLQKKCELHIEEYKVIIIAVLVQPRDSYSLSYFQILSQNEV